jgi:hypothetical protein
MISSRLMPAACVCIALALVPTLIHSYGGGLATDGRITAALPTSLGSFSSTPSDRDATWGKRRFDSDDWVERNYTDGVHPVRLTVARSYDPKTLYHHPELAVAYRTSFEAVRSRRLPERPDIPVHVLAPGPGEQSRAMYVLHYDGRFVDDPIMFHIRTAGELLFSKRKPMTLFFVLDTDPVAADQVGKAATQVLFAAIDSFLK